MRWNAAPSPKSGDTRYGSRFALFPVRVGNRWIWLEKYLVKQVFLTTIWGSEGRMLKEDIVKEKLGIPDVR